MGTADEPRVVLRAAVGTGGVWELDVTAGATDPTPSLHLRGNFLDTGRLAGPPDGVSNPFRPAESLYHYQCADIKIDARQAGPGTEPPYFQTDPAASALPLSYVLFGALADNSDHLPGEDLAMVHVQVHNVSATPVDGVTVWALYCNASAGPPALSASPS